MTTSGATIEFRQQPCDIPKETLWLANWTLKQTVNSKWFQGQVEEQTRVVRCRLKDGQWELVDGPYFRDEALTPLALKEVADEYQRLLAEMMLRE